MPNSDDQPVLDFGKFCALQNPRGDALPLFFGQIHAASLIKRRLRIQS